MRVVCLEDKCAIGRKQKNEGEHGGNKNPQKGNQKKKRISCLPCRRQDVAVAPPVHVLSTFCSILVSLPNHHRHQLSIETHDFCFQPSYLIPSISFFFGLYAAAAVSGLSLFFPSIHFDPFLFISFLNGYKECLLFPHLLWTFLRRAIFSRWITAQPTAPATYANSEWKCWTIKQRPGEKLF